MLGPRPDLLRRYGTGDVLLAKTAGELSLVARLSMGLLNAGLGHHLVRSRAEERMEEEYENTVRRALERERLSPATRALEHTRVPEIIGHGVLDPAKTPESDLMRELGMERLASVARASGRALAKLGSIGGLALGATVAGGALLGVKGVNKGLKVLGKQEPGVKNYGAGAYQVPFGVNEYGHAQQGTPLT